MLSLPPEYVQSASLATRITTLHNFSRLFYMDSSLLAEPFIAWPSYAEQNAHFSIFAWRIPWTGELGGLQPVGSHSQT